MELATVIVIALASLGFGAYIVLMIFFPEWVGITGKSGMKTLNEHQEGSIADESNIFSESTVNSKATPKAEIEKL